jgi:hypothetical protein
MSLLQQGIEHGRALSVKREREASMKTMRVILATVVLAGTAAAHEGHEHSASAGSLTGEVVDITCLMDHNSKGAQHSACAQKCLEKGLPVGLLVGDKLYLVMQASHELPNAKLAPFAGKRVTIKGTITQQHGLRAIDLESVEAAN